MFTLKKSWGKRCIEVDLAHFVGGFYFTSEWDLALHCRALLHNWLWELLLMEEILHQLIGSLSRYLQGFIHPRWCRISSINSMFNISSAWISMHFCHLSGSLALGSLLLVACQIVTVLMWQGLCTVNLDLSVRLAGNEVWPPNHQHIICLPSYGYLELWMCVSTRVIR